MYRAFSLTWPAFMQVHWNKKIVYKRKSSTPTGLVWDTNMAAVTSCENALCTELHKLKLDNNAINLILILVLFSKKVSVAPTGVQICFPPLRQYYKSIKTEICIVQ